MRYCSNCGKPLEEGSQFCTNCGSAQAPISKRPRSASFHQLHCPKCGSTSLSPIVESEISSGSAAYTSVGRRHGVSQFKFNSTHRNYWMCSNCGHKFRNIQNLDEEIASQEKAKRAVLLTDIIIFLFTIFYIAIHALFLTILCIALVITLTVVYLYLQNKLSTLRKEKAYLEKHCFN